MAYRRYLLRRTNLSNCNFRPSFSYVLHHTIDEPNQRQQEKPVPAAITSLIQARSFGSFLKGSTGFGASSKRRTIFNNTFSGYSLCRYMSTLNDDSDKINFGIDVADVLAETTIDTVASQAGSVVDEVAIAAADSLLPVKMVQYAIDYVHSFTGMNWWAAIVMTTFLVRIATIPSLVNQLKANSRFHVLRLKVDEIKAQMEDKESDPAAVAEGQKQIAKLFKEFGASRFPSLQGFFIQASILISFFCAISNMAEKMPSFKHGGAYWFTDLTTPDSLYIFPVLTALSFLVIVEHIVQEASYGTVVESSTTMKNLSRAVSVLVVPCAMELPKAILCFWLTSNLFLIIYGLVISVPSVKKSLGIPVIVVDSAPADAPKSQR
ncbi:mitochondrial inner membrane protein OXA1-like isoform X1 [Arachis ipaensis]|nr:mitochondrial inner membrane protein OXA1-like isoform X1 [Arachis ipaensis]XP_016189802.1 mitochondrial inner membrane protein OXA1-like isoform X1 [Arachis ipaensis]XP_020975110.1 mitochondrial inner membrane protein OXA1-like isoform X1 [Arachis ipaensis]XP_025638189.1 mitochondrial inner membrane protein OXA1-like isoform X1 [Arachis hypogaea]XP_025638190.1 mitochondrial inner membrane protein OXA1-like isoform X1 [Arachis hypogaea]QHO02739.1 Mitochondrial inner membrane protein [Arachi